MKSLLFVLLLVCGCSFHTPDPAITGPGDDDAGTDSGSDDAGVMPDAPPDAPRVVVLSETSTTPHNGSSIFCHSGQMLRDNYWYRAFAMSDFPQITAPLHIMSVTFGAEDARNATPTITLFSYTGSIGESVLDTTKMLTIASHSEAVPDNASPQAITFPVDATIPLGGVFVVQISAMDTSNGSGMVTSLFHAAFSDDAQTRPTYFSSNTCGIGAPVAQGGASLIVDVAGTY